MHREENQGLLMETEDEIVLHNDHGQNGRTTKNHCHSNLLNHRQDSKAGAERVLFVVVFLCTFFIMAQFIGGYLAHSIAIITDAGHIFTDVLSMVISIFMLRLSRCPANQKFSFGYFRAEFVGALLSLFIVWAVTVTMVVLATERILSGKIEVQPNIMMISSIIGLSSNLIMGMVLKCCGSLPRNHAHAHQRSQSPSENVNIRAAFIHILGDFVQSVAVFFASLLIKYTGFHIFDPLCTYLFSLVIVCTSVPVAKDIFRTFMEATPKELNYLEIQSELAKFDGVQRVHSLCIWSLGSDTFSLSAHLVIEDDKRSIQITDNVSGMLRRRYGFHFLTIQTELPDYTSSDCEYCAPLT